MVLGANAEKPAMRLEEEEDPFDDDQCIRPKDANKSGAS